MSSSLKIFSCMIAARIGFVEIFHYFFSWYGQKGSKAWEMPKGLHLDDILGEKNQFLQEAS
jgi:hypothetical protein